MTNPFYVAPVDVSGPANILAGAMAERKQQKGIQAKMQQAREIYNTGDLSLMSDFLIANPELSQTFSAAMTFKNQATKDNAITGLREILGGADPEQILKDRIQFVTDQDGDPTDSIKELQLYKKDPEAFMQNIEESYAMMDPQGYKAFRSVTETADGGKRFEQASGMPGWAFDVTTGTYRMGGDDTDLANAVKTGKLDIKTRQSINKDVTSMIANATDIRATAADLERLGELDTGPAQLAMVFKFMKALDPASVVREGEFASAKNAAGVPENVRNIYNQISEGKILGPEQTKLFVTTAKDLANSAVTSATTTVNSYLDTFEDTLSDAFKDRIRGRIPAAFGESEEPATPVVLYKHPDPSIGDLTEDDIKTTMENNEWTRQQVLQYFSEIGATPVQR